MEKQDYDRLLDIVYELEGLIHLCKNREDCPESIVTLIKRKCDSLAIFFDKKDENETEAESNVENLDSIGEYNFEAEPLSLTSEYSIEEEYVQNNESAQNDDSASEESDEIIGNDMDLNSEGSEPGESYSIDEEESESESDENEKNNDGENEMPRGKLVFSVNDRFRFKKELFGGSDADFNTALTFVASMDNFEEAEDYFINELSLDPSNGSVVDFLKVVRKYFRS